MGIKLHNISGWQQYEGVTILRAISYESALFFKGVEFSFKTRKQGKSQNLGGNRI